MYHVFTSNGNLEDIKGFKHRHPGGETTIVIGSDANNDFGGGTLQIVIDLEGDVQTKTINSYDATSDVSQPIVFTSPKPYRMDFVLSGATSPDLYLEVH